MTKNQTGRTARIGNEGLATSFYNEDKDMEIAPDLVKILIESKQRVPDFLESYKPMEETVNFEDDTDDENDDADGGNPDSAWGGMAMETTEDDADAAPSGPWGGVDDSNDAAPGAPAWD